MEIKGTQETNIRKKNKDYVVLAYRQTDQWAGIERSETNSHIYGQLILKKGSQMVQWVVGERGRIAFSPNEPESTGYPNAKNKQIRREKETNTPCTKTKTNGPKYKS